jgi:hypothetical protein
MVLRDSYLETPAARKDCAELTMDGTYYGTHYTAPYKRDNNGAPIPHTRVDWLTQTPVNAITCPEAGYRGGTDPHHRGHGWNWCALNNRRALVLAYVIHVNNASEKALSGPRLLELYGSAIVPRLRPKRLGLLSADGGFDSPEVREGSRLLGLIPNIPVVSGGAKTESAKRNMAKQQATHVEIDGHPGLYADGLRELYCACGEMTTQNRSFLHPDGFAVIRTEWGCPLHGTCTATNGDWRVSSDGKRLVKRRRFDSPSARLDELFGNPFTQTYPLSKVFAGKRFGKHEGFHSQLHTRFGLLKEKTWFRAFDQAHQEAALTVMITWILAGIHDAALDRS